MQRGHLWTCDAEVALVILICSYVWQNLEKSWQDLLVVTSSQDFERTCQDLKSLIVKSLQDLERSCHVGSLHAV